MEAGPRKLKGLWRKGKYLGGKKMGRKQARGLRLIQLLKHLYRLQVWSDKLEYGPGKTLENIEQTTSRGRNFWKCSGCNWRLLKWIQMSFGPSKWNNNLDWVTNNEWSRIILLIEHEYCPQNTSFKHWKGAWATIFAERDRNLLKIH